MLGKRLLIFATLGAFALAGCKGGDDTGPTDTDTDTDTDTQVGEAAVILDGAAFLKVGNEVQLSATTINGDDAGYTWSSSDELVATVTETGLLLGEGQGEVVISATGDSTGVTGEIGIYVSHEIPYLDEWQSSGHADYTAEAFVHWDEDDPAEVPANCAACHSTPGFKDRIGADGTAVNAEQTVDSAHPVGTVVECEACHNAVTADLSTVTFPSGVTLEGLGPEAICMTCHQGRASTGDVDDDIATAEGNASVTLTADTPSDDLGFINQHYYAAGATLNAGTVEGGYQYDGNVYDVRFRHVEGYDVCVECHDQHTLEVRVDECADCHDGVSTVDDLKDVRMDASTVDYDGDGDTSEGIYHEIDTLRTELYAAMQAYPAAVGTVTAADGTTGVTLSDICYSAGSYPYFFVDTDGSGGACDASEATFSNGYDTWTPRLVRAAYNFQSASVDPGNFAHNAKYTIQILHDSITDLNSVLPTDDKVTVGVREDPGHFNGASEAARHWDEDDEVSASCAACHGGSDGFRFYVEYGVGLEHLEQANGLECSTCHEQNADYSGTPALFGVTDVTFPSGITLSSDDAGDIGTMLADGSATCANCHSGREGKASIAAYLGPDPSGSSYGFRNVHYHPAAATLFGSDAAVGWEYTGETYNPHDIHNQGAASTQCTYCHDAAATGHSFQISDRFADCTGCHGEATSVAEIRRGGGSGNFDYDGDGITNPTSSTLQSELAVFQGQLLAAIQEHANEEGYASICYDEHSYPYWFVDTDNSGGHCDEGEATFANGYGSNFDAPMVQAAHNYQFSIKDRGAWAHNMRYMTQLLYDSIRDLEDNEDNESLSADCPSVPTTSDTECALVWEDGGGTPHVLQRWSDE